MDSMRKYMYMYIVSCFSDFELKRKKNMVKLNFLFSVFLRLLLRSNVFFCPSKSIVHPVMAS